MIKKILPWVVFAGLFVLIILGIALKDDLNNYLSTQMKGMASDEMVSSSEAYIDSAFNYTENGAGYKVTFLEFGATGCSACKRMESVMEEISQKHPETVNVVFLNVLKSEHQELMKYYGVATIPTQILLNKEGEEFFRHSGYYSARELENEFLSNN